MLQNPLEVWGVASVGSNGDQWIDYQTSKLFLQQNHISAFVPEWCEGQLWFDLPVHEHALRHTYLWNIIEHFAVTGLARELHDIVNELPFMVSLVIPLDPIKTLYSVS